ncbi:MAG: LysR family transcriptional regulator [Gammaproteobacteria bacterium]|nr:LysR family transcriptional regulator [Gammaproteobacteria bacterium]
MADRRLQVFHTVARLLSFTKAAETLHMTQPAVTFQVRQLEDYFNTRLFDRTHNRVTLTEIGRKAYGYSERIFELYSEMEDAVKEMTGDVSGALTIGASTTIAEYMLPGLLRSYRDKHPNVILRLKVSNSEGIISMVENSMIDLGIVEAPVTNKNLLVEACRMDQLVAVAPPNHPIAEKESITMEDLLQHPFICREEGSGTREVIMEYMSKMGLERNGLNVCLELGSSESIKGAVEAGMGITILSQATIAKEVSLGTLTYTQLDPILDREFGFVRQRQKFRLRAMEELLIFAREYCHDHPGKKTQKPTVKST